MIDLGRVTITFNYVYKCDDEIFTTTKTLDKSVPDIPDICSELVSWLKGCGYGADGLEEALREGGYLE